MQALVKDQPRLNIAIHGEQLSPKKDILIHKKNRIQFKSKQKICLILFSLLIFLIFPEKPKESSSICNTYNPQEVCNIW